MRTSMFALMTLSLVSIRGSEAQSRMSLPPPTHIRYSLPSSKDAKEAEVLVQRGDSLWIRSLQTGDTTTIALSSLTRLDVSTGRDRHVLRDAGIGLLVGVVGGTIGGYASGDDDLNASSSGWGAETAGTKAAYGAAGFGLLGAGVGALIGVLDENERWQPVVVASGRGPAKYFGTRVRTYNVGVRVAIF